MKISIRFSAIVIAIIFFGSLVESWLSQKGIPLSQQTTEAINQGPTIWHFYGTDALGRDLFLRCFQAARISLLIGIISVFISTLLSIVFAILGYVGGSKVDQILSLVIDVFMGLPSLVLAAVATLYFNQVIGPTETIGQIFTLSLAIGVTSWMSMARQIRVWIDVFKDKEFVNSARATGASELRVVVKHIFPQFTGLLIIGIGLIFPQYLLFESLLSFVGIGIQSPNVSWGTLINEGWKVLELHPHLLIAPSAMLYLMVLCFNMVFDDWRSHFENANSDSF